MNRALRILAAASLALGLHTGVAGAHEYWLSPSRYAARAGEAVTIGALAGEGLHGEWKPWSPGRAVRFVARTDRLVDLARGAAAGASPWITFVPADDGGALLGYESSWIPIELPAASFEAYLLEEGFAGPLAARRAAGEQGPGRERYRRCAKAWLAGSAAGRATQPLALPLEIVPLASPGSAATLRVRVLANGRPVPGLRVTAWRSDLASDGAPRDPAVSARNPEAARAVTDRRGEVVIPCEAAGEWLLGAVRMEPCPDRAIADWQTTWASFTFARAAGPAAPEGRTAARAR